MFFYNTSFIFYFQIKSESIFTLNNDFRFKILKQYDNVWFSIKFVGFVNEDQTEV